MQTHVRFMRGVKQAKESKGKWPTQNPKIEPLDNALQGLAIESTNVPETGRLMKPFLFSLAVSTI